MLANALDDINCHISATYLDNLTTHVYGVDYVLSIGGMTLALQGQGYIIRIKLKKLTKIENILNSLLFFVYLYYSFCLKIRKVI